MALAEKAATTVNRALQAITTLFIAFIVFYGKGVIADIGELQASDTAQNLKLTEMEANRYTVDDAKLDMADVAEKINGIKVESAGDSAKLDALGDDMSELKVSLSALVTLIHKHELERNP